MAYVREQPCIQIPERAVQSGNVVLADFLLSSGAVLHMPLASAATTAAAAAAATALSSNLNRNRALHLAVRAGPAAAEDMVRLLVRKGGYSSPAFVNEKAGALGETALALVLRGGALRQSESLIRLLVECGATFPNNTRELVDNASWQWLVDVFGEKLSLSGTMKWLRTLRR